MFWYFHATAQAWRPLLLNMALALSHPSQFYCHAIVLHRKAFENQTASQWLFSLAPLPSNPDSIVDAELRTGLQISRTLGWCLSEPPFDPTRVNLGSWNNLKNYCTYGFCQLQDAFLSPTSTKLREGDYSITLCPPFHPSFRPFGLNNYFLTMLPSQTLNMHDHLQRRGTPRATRMHF